MRTKRLHCVPQVLSYLLLPWAVGVSGEPQLNLVLENACNLTAQCTSGFRSLLSHPQEYSQTLLKMSHNADLREPVSLPVENSTKSFWIDSPGSNPLAEDGSAGPLTGDADVCIIGSGITGVSTAWHLSKLFKSNRNQLSKPVTAVILEARQFCSGATGRNGGNLTPFLGGQFTNRPTEEAVKSYGIERYTTTALVDFITKKDLAGRVDLVEGGHVTIFKTEEDELDAKKEWKKAKDAGLYVDHGWISNQELVERYGLSPELNYTGVFFQSYNLWPCKLVTHLFKDITSISPAPQHISERHSSDSRGRRWLLHTPRGDVSCAYVAHATNGYASHLLPFLAGGDNSEGQRHSKSFSFKEDQDSGRSRGSFGITPHRGQVGAVRASVNSSTLRWRNSWGFGGDGSGSEYWFPRHQDAKLTTHDSVSNGNENPVIILGGGGRLVGVADDSVLNSTTSAVLRSFLPSLYPEQFLDPRNTSEDTWEKEWTGIMGYTRDGDPFVGPIVVPRELTSNGEADTESYDGQYIAAGFSGHGMPRTYACAEFVAGMIAARLQGEKWIKPSWIPDRYLTWATDLETLRRRYWS